MKVQKLIEILSMFNKDLDVVAVLDHPERGAMPLAIEGASLTNVIQFRDAKGRPQIRADNRKGRVVVTIDVTDDF